MPIEIKELHIKAVVGGNSREQGAASLKPEDILKLKAEISGEIMRKMKKIAQQKIER